MTNGRTELAQFILNEDNAPFECLLEAIRFIKMNSPNGPRITAALERALHRDEHLF